MNARTTHSCAASGRQTVAAAPRPIRSRPCVAGSQQQQQRGFNSHPSGAGRGPRRSPSRDPSLPIRDHIHVRAACRPAAGACDPRGPLSRPAGRRASPSAPPSRTVRPADRDLRKSPSGHTGPARRRRRRHSVPLPPGADTSCVPVRLLSFLPPTPKTRNSHCLVHSHV
jgi:hypothetical protein